jgi:hypothetical protein
LTTWVVTSSSVPSGENRANLNLVIFLFVLSLCLSRFCRRCFQILTRSAANLQCFATPKVHLRRIPSSVSARAAPPPRSSPSRSSSYYFPPLSARAVSMSCWCWPVTALEGLAQIVHVGGLICLIHSHEMCEWSYLSRMEEIVPKDSSVWWSSSLRQWYFNSVIQWNSILKLTVQVTMILNMHF